MKVINKFTVSTKKEKRTKKERNGCCYSSFSFNSFCPTSGVHPKKLSKFHADKLNNLSGKCYNPATVDNFRELKKILDQRKVRLVCVQYPMRSMQPLKDIFQEENVIFVDNKKRFKDAVKKEGYNEYFRDVFGGDFGHCTAKGNRLLAENIADTISKEVFRK